MRDLYVVVKIHASIIHVTRTNNSLNVLGINIHGDTRILENKFGLTV